MASIHLNSFSGWEKSFIEVPCFMAHRGANDSRSSSRDAWIDDWVGSWFLFEVMKGGWKRKRYTFWTGWWFQIYIFYFPPYLGQWSNLTNIFQMGWNHQPVKWFFLIEDEPPLLWPTVWCYRDSFQATDLFVSHASKVKAIHDSKHPTTRFRFFNHQGVLGLQIPGEFRVKVKLIGRVWVGLKQSNSKG